MELTIQDLKELLYSSAPTPIPPCPVHPILDPGNKVIIRTVTYHYIGKVVKVTPTTVLLEDASWLAESALWSETLKTGKVNEVEPFPDVVAVERTAIVDSTSWNHDLPRERK